MRSPAKKTHRIPKSESAPLERPALGIAGKQQSPNREGVLQEALQRERNLLRTVADSLPMSVFVKDLDLRYLLINEFGTERLGCSKPEEVIGRKLTEFPDQGLAATQAEADDRQVMESGQAVLNREESWKEPGGNIGWRLTTKVPLKDVNGNIIGVVGSSHDITAQKRGEDALREGERRFRDLFDEAPVAMHEIDTDGIVRRVNRAECSLMGFNASDMLGKHASEFVAKEEQEKSRVAVRQKLAGEKPLVTFQREYTRGDGVHLVIEVHENLIRDKHGSIIGIRSAMLDVTVRKQAEQELERKTREITLLGELGSVLQTCLTAVEAYGIIAQFGQKLFPGTSGSLAVISASRNVVESVSAWGDPLGGEPVFGPNDCWALRSGRSHFIDDLKSPLKCRHVSLPAETSCVCIPMVGQGESLGLIHLQSHRDESGETLGPARQLLATRFCEQIGLSLANLRLRETLRIQSIRDPLTGLFNRRYMEESLERELRRAIRKQKPLAAIMIDVDYFKKLNDTFGHEAGDNVLRELGAYLRKAIRAEDIACRYGGEEFVLILPDGPLEDIQRRAEQMREGIKRISFQRGSQNLGSITMSLGLAAFPMHGASVDALLRVADDALYQAKAQGRDRLIIGKPPEEEPEREEDLEASPSA